MSNWRFEVGGVYQHAVSMRKVLILHEGENPDEDLRRAGRRHTVAIPLDADTQLHAPVFLDWNYPTGACAINWKLISRVATNPRTSEAT